MSLFDRLAFSIPAFAVTSVLTRTNRALEVACIFYQTFKVLWQILRADNVCTLLFRYFISSYSSTGCWNHCTIRVINQISEKVPYEIFSISFHFHKTVHENTFALTPPCFIWVSRAIAKHARIALTAFFRLRNDLYCVGWGVKLYSLTLTAFCQCSSFIVNDITKS